MPSKSSGKHDLLSRTVRYTSLVVLVGIAVAIYIGGFLSTAPEPSPQSPSEMAQVPLIPQTTDKLPDISAPRVPEPFPHSPPSGQQVDDRNVQHYEQLLRKRLDFEKKIFEAMELYRTTSQKVYEQRTQLRRYLGDKPISESVEQFSKGNEIPSDLRIAYSCWRTLLPDETQRLQIAAWIDKQQASYILETLDIQIKEFENRRQLGRIFDKEELAEIDRLLVLAQQVVGWETIDVSDKAILEEEAIEKLKTELENWE